VASAGGNESETNGWEDPGVVGLGWDEVLAVLALVIWEWRSGGEDALLIGRGVCLFGCALCLGCWVGEWEDEWVLAVLAHFLDDFLGDEVWAAGNADDGGGLVLLDALEDGADWLHLVHEWLVALDKASTAGVD